ncbi:aspartate aminotransferase family protein [Nitrosomonadaceae bacterium]|nr:aspartate aminotransferase family protein [Nitrosomonadaceae bacterium]
MKNLMNTYSRLPVTFSRGEGVWLWDDQGNKYLDALAGIAVCGIGHSHPKLVKAISEQAGTLIHTSNLYHIDKQDKLAKKLAILSGLNKSFFCNSGAEANEAAIKLARLYGHNKGIDQPTIIVMENSFHGRTMATLTASGNRKVQAGFEPLLTGFARVPFNDLDAIAQVSVHNKNVVAILVEPYQGEGGVNVPQANYLKRLRQICDENSWLLMLDEVQCGIGRSGKWFAFQNSEIVPDVITLAKSLGSGVPIGACIAGDVAGDIFKPGSHASTFGGNPLACTAAITTLDIIEEENLMCNALEQGDFIRKNLLEQLGNLSHVTQIRGHGLMIGIELTKPCGGLVKKALEQGLLLNVTSDKVIRLLPPLVIKQNESEQIINMVSTLIKEF